MSVSDCACLPDVPNPPRINAAQCGEREALLDWSSSGDNNAPLQGYVVQYVTQFHPDDWKDAENKIPTSSPRYEVSVSQSPSSSGSQVHCCHPAVWAGQPQPPPWPNAFWAQYWRTHSRSPVSPSQHALRQLSHHPSLYCTHFSLTTHLCIIRHYRIH